MVTKERERERERELCTVDINEIEFAWALDDDVIN